MSYFILGLPRTEYYRKVYGLRDYQKKEKATKEIEPFKKEMIEKLSFSDQEYGHKKIWALMRYRHSIEITRYETYRIMKQRGLEYLLINTRRIILDSLDSVKNMLQVYCVILFIHRLPSVPSVSSLSGRGL
ncbi:MAG: IS3 family transposase [Nitrospirota bacterium]